MQELIKYVDTKLKLCYWKLISEMKYEAYHTEKSAQETNNPMPYIS